MGDSMTTVWLKMKVTFGEFNRFKIVISAIGTIGIFRARHVKIHSHVVDPRAIFFDSIWLIEFDSTFEISSHIDNFLPPSLT